MEPPDHDSISPSQVDNPRELKLALRNGRPLDLTSSKGVVTLPAASARCQRLKNCQAAATAVRHVSIAAARSVRCVWAEVRWRWTLKML